MSILNNRKIEVVVGKQGEEGYAIRNHRIDFNVSYTGDAGEPPKGRITIHQPPERLAGLLKRDGANFISLSAGYGDNASVIFAGRPVRSGVRLSRTSANWELVVEALSGGERYRNARTQTSVGGSTNFEGFVREAIRNADLQVGVLDLEQAPNTLPRVVFEGGSFRILERLAGMARCELVFDGAKVHFLQAGVGLTEGTEAIASFSSRMGTLIGQPTETDKGLSVRVLLDPRIRVGKRVQVEYYDPFVLKYVSSTQVVRSVTFRGSNYGNDYYADIIGYTPTKAAKDEPTNDAEQRVLMKGANITGAKSGNLDVSPTDLPPR